jgi:hypothetical protein
MRKGTVHLRPALAKHRQGIFKGKRVGLRTLHVGRDENKTCFLTYRLRASFEGQGELSVTALA